MEQTSVTGLGNIKQTRETDKWDATQADFGAACNLD